MLFNDSKAYTDAIVALSKALIGLGENEIDFLFGGRDSDAHDHLLMTDIFDTVGELDPKLCKKPPKPASRAA